MAREHGFANLEADSLRQLGVLAYDTGQLENAVQCYQQSLPLYEMLKHKHGESTIYNNLSNVAISQGNIELALKSLEKAQQIDVAIGDREGQARVLTNLSSQNIDLGSYETAQKYSLEALNLCREIDIPFGECFNLINLSLTSHFLQEDSAAEQYSQEAVQLAKNIGSQFLLGLALKDRGFLLFTQRRWAEAEEAYQASLTYLAHTDQVLESHIALAWLSLQQGGKTVVHAHLSPVLTHLKEQRTLDGTSRSFFILLLTYKVLFELNDAYSDEILQQAYGRLNNWANQITNPDRRSSFLHNVAINKEIVAIFHQTPPPN